MPAPILSSSGAHQWWLTQSGGTSNMASRRTPRLLMRSQSPAPFITPMPQVGEGLNDAGLPGEPGPPDPTIEPTPIPYTPPQPVAPPAHNPFRAGWPADGLGYPYGLPDSGLTHGVDIDGNPVAPSGPRDGGPRRPATATMPRVVVTPPGGRAAGILAAIRRGDYQRARGSTDQSIDSAQTMAMARDRGRLSLIPGQWRTGDAGQTQFSVRNAHDAEGNPLFGRSQISPAMRAYLNSPAALERARRIGAMLMHRGG
jgi:hypothetical protein